MDWHEIYKRDCDFATEPMSEVPLPIKYKCIPRRKKSLCNYISGQGDSISNELYLVSPYRDRYFWSIWQVLTDLCEFAGFINRRLPAIPLGWVRAKPDDDPNEIAKFLFIGSLGQLDNANPGVPIENVTDAHAFSPDLLSRHDIIASAFEDYKGRVEMRLKEYFKAK